MSNKTVLIVVVILIAILAWVIIGGSEPTPAPEPDPEPVATLPLPDKLVANHYFNEGTHTIEGTMQLPTPCHTLGNEVMIAESFPEQVTVHFQVNAGEGLCTQVISDKFYQVTFQASGAASIAATLNGNPIELEFSESHEGILK